MMIDLERVAALIDDVLQSHDELLAAHREAIATAKAALAFAAQMAAERDAVVRMLNQRLRPDDQAITIEDWLALVTPSGTKPS